MDWFSLIIGGIVGTIISMLVKSVWDRVQVAEVIRNFHIKKRRKLLEKRSIHDWLESYYTERGKESDLYLCQIGSKFLRIPFLTSPSFSEIDLNISDFSSRFIYAGHSDKSFPIEHRLVRRRKALGQVLFDEPTIYLDGIHGNINSLSLVARSCRYMEMFSLLATIEEETYRSITSAKKTKTPIRDTLLPDFETAVQVKQRPLSIGCQVALLFRIKDSWEFLLQVRSHSTVTFGGTTALIPVFGLSPVSKDESENLLLHNIVKEYCEELFDYEDLIRLASCRRASPLWFLTLPEANEFLSALKESKIIIRFNGMGFDGLNASLTLSFATIITDENLSHDLKKRIKANWEVATKEETETPLEFIDFRSPRLAKLFQSKSYHIGSAFSVSRALDSLQSVTL